MTPTPAPELLPEEIDAAFKAVLNFQYCKFDQCRECTVKLIPHLNTIRNALNTRPQPREAWRLVPVEPTEEMLNAAFDATSWPTDFQIHSATYYGVRDNIRKEYIAMLNSAPPQAQSQMKTEGEK